MTTPMNLENHNEPRPVTEDTIDLYEYWYRIRSHMLGILGFTVVASIIAILFIHSMTPIYRGEATLLIESNEQKIVNIQEVYQLGTGKSEYYFTQFEILKSRELAKTVVERNQDRYTEVMMTKSNNPISLLKTFIYGERKTNLEMMINSFMANTTITPVRSTQLVKVAFDSPDPQLAALMANELAEAYIENNLDARLAMTQKAASWLASRINGLKERLQESELKLQQYRESEDLVDVEGIKTLASKQLEDVSSKLAEARQRRVEAENIAIQLNKFPSHDIKQLSSMPAVLNHHLVQQFKQQEAAAEQRYLELSKRYGPKHPKIIAAKSDLDAARESTATQILQVVEGIHKDYDVAKATEDSLTKEVDVLKIRVQELTRKQYRFDELSREVSVNKQLYDSFFSRIKETSEAGEMQTANARVVDAAVVPVSPIKPRVMILSLVAIAVSMGIAILLALVKEAYDSTIRFRDDVVFKLHSQLLGVLAVVKDNDKKSDSVALMYAASPTGTFAESIRTIRTGVVLSALDSPHKTIIVTSSIPSEGKTTLASNLAASFGQIGKTLLIDADMRRPSVAKHFGIPMSSPGLSNLVAGAAEPKECIHRVEKLSIDIIPAGLVPPNPLELLSSKRFTAVLESLEKYYDRIIIDTAPCEVVSDALVLAAHASAIIYVVKADSTNSKIVKSGISRLRAAGTPITGVVLNQVNVDNRRYGYGYGRYYGGYYDYYGYTSSDSPGDKKSTESARKKSE